MLTKKDKGDIKDIVVDVIKDVVLPAFKTVATKNDLKDVEIRLSGRIDSVENRLENVEMKLDRVIDNQVVHEKRIKKLESSRALA